MSGTWVDVGPLNLLPEETGVVVEAMGHRVAVFRIGNQVYAIGDRCSHAEASLAEGEVFDTEVECPRHGSSFDLINGRPLSLPATRPVPTYEVRVDGGSVFVLLDPMEATA